MIITLTDKRFRRRGWMNTHRGITMRNQILQSLTEEGQTPTLLAQATGFNVRAIGYFLAVLHGEGLIDCSYKQMPGNASLRPFYRLRASCAARVLPRGGEDVVNPGEPNR